MYEPKTFLITLSHPNLDIACLEAAKEFRRWNAEDNGTLVLTEVRVDVGYRDAVEYNYTFTVK